MADRLEAIETNGGGYAATEGDRVMLWVRRWMPFLALAAVFALFILVLPTRQNTGDDADTASSLTSGSTSDQAVTDLPGSTDDGLGSTSVAGTSATNSPGRTATGNRTAGVVPVPSTGRGGGGGGSTAQPGGLNPLAWTKTGKTRGGFDCKKGVRQIPWSVYAAPCFPSWSGDNGGATWRGVTPKEIVILRRDYPDSANSQAVDAAVQQAGFASAEEFDETRHKFIDYFNKIFELWGRKVKFIEYKSEYGNSTDESQSKGKEGACADADSIIAKYKPFLVLTGSSPFGECAAERHLTTIGAGAYYPERWYRKYHPYAWAGVMECERIAHMNAEYIGKRLSNRPAKWAKGLQKGKPRRIGIYVPTNDEYQYCLNMAEKEAKDKYNATVASRYNYILDISRFPDEAAKGIVQFNADGVTTIILACDPLSPIFLTQSAKGQNYFPEWVINSAGLTDADQFARLWDQSEIQWSLFGESQLGENAQILGPKGEGTTTYKRAFGTTIPPGTQTEYYAMSGLFTILQAIGPNLTPFTLAATYPKLPPGGAPTFEVGYTYYGTSPTGGEGYDHTAVDDMKEVYWLCTKIGGGDAEGSSLCSEPKGFDGKGGVYKSTYGGRRFLPGQFPKGEPPVFPEKPK